MVSTWKHGVACIAAIVVGGCSYADDGLWPSLNGEDPAGADAKQAMVPADAPPSAAVESSAPTLSPVTAQTRDSAPPTTQASARAVPLELAATEATPNTGTFVGQQVVTLRSELAALKARIGTQNGEYQALYADAAQASQRYFTLVGDISSRLQVGTTPGNPVLVGQWQNAQNEVDTVAVDTSRLSELSNRIAANLDLANFLIESTRSAYSVQGSLEEDHRQLAIIEDDLNRVMVSNDRLLNEINESISRHNSFLFGERRNLTTLALAVSTGRSYGPNLGELAAPNLVAAALPMARRGAPLVVIRFDRPDVDYEQALYESVSAALARQAEARFELVAVTPLSGGPSDVAANAGVAKRNAERVMRSLIDMGLPVDRVIMSAETSDSARTNEVQIYQR